jgi:hypothetical protein
MARRRLASYVPEPVKRPLQGVRRRIVRVRDSVGSRAAVLAAALPKPPEPRVEGISQRLLEAKRTELAAARHFGRHDLAAMEALLERADDVVTVGEAFRPPPEGWFAHRYLAPPSRRSSSRRGRPKPETRKTRQVAELALVPSVGPR